VKTLIKAILFDLDGTLLQIDMEYFLQKYLRKLALHFAHLMEPDAFVANLLASTYAMIKDDNPELTNQQVFMADFFKQIPYPREKILPLIDGFYEDVFPKLREYTAVFPEAPQVIETAKKIGCRLVIATNPLFPLKAINHRMEWAGVLDYDFDLVTSYENMHFCKPNPRYYLEICDYIGIQPEQCLMVGNDVVDDIAAAAKVGMKTALVTNMIVNKGGMKPVADYCIRVDELTGLLFGLNREIQEESV
jgi:HAD superfamily hydrolase (TIGR01549 family)